MASYNPEIAIVDLLSSQEDDVVYEPDHPPPSPKKARYSDNVQTNSDILDNYVTREEHQNLVAKVKAMENTLRKMEQTFSSLRTVFVEENGAPREPEVTPLSKGLIKVRKASFLSNTSTPKRRRSAITQNPDQPITNNASPREMNQDAQAAPVFELGPDRNQTLRTLVQTEERPSCSTVSENQTSAENPQIAPQPCLAYKKAASRSPSASIFSASSEVTITPVPPKSTMGGTQSNMNMLSPSNVPKLPVPGLSIPSTSTFEGNKPAPQSVNSLIMNANTNSKSDGQRTSSRDSYIPIKQELLNEPMIRTNSESFFRDRDNSILAFIEGTGGKLRKVDKYAAVAGYLLSKDWHRCKPFMNDLDPTKVRQNINCVKTQAVIIAALLAIETIKANAGLEPCPIKITIVTKNEKLRETMQSINAVYNNSNCMCPVLECIHENRWSVVSNITTRNFVSQFPDDLPRLARAVGNEAVEVSWRDYSQEEINSTEITNFKLVLQAAVKRAKITPSSKVSKQPIENAVIL